jgi:Protein of unknown function (DUF3093)
LVLYKERVTPNLGTFAAVSVLLPSTVIISEPFDLLVGLVVGLIGVLGIWALLFFRAPQIRVTKEKLYVGRASIPRDLIGEPVAISKSEVFGERGPKLDPAAYKVFQGSIKTAIKIPISDPQDPTPYWLVSTRNPTKLAIVLKSS